MIMIENNLVVNWRNSWKRLKLLSFLKGSNECYLPWYSKILAPNLLYPPVLNHCITTLLQLSLWIESVV